MGNEDGLRRCVDDFARYASDFDRHAALMDFYSELPHELGHQRRSEQRAAHGVSTPWAGPGLTDGAPPVPPGYDVEQELDDLLASYIISHEDADMEWAGDIALRIAEIFDTQGSRDDALAWWIESAGKGNESAREYLTAEAEAVERWLITFYFSENCLGRPNPAFEPGGPGPNDPQPPYSWPVVRWLPPEVRRGYQGTQPVSGACPPGRQHRRTEQASGRHRKAPEQRYARYSSETSSIKSLDDPSRGFPRGEET
ncbi:hypothetical protein [Sphaerisporangium sp. TRM90804]|uniref:hypothetical protein n=1 Tax=Sphaerisporangium sp. TRM90804 TaxID=3031113 RepID=UPI002449913C|nr:hypothetical protein [Sphaerisporangium sp. TRM90804]MDH2424505.1 hypothetical protein [Sphaerisporangium sp. TRM90804]